MNYEFSTSRTMRFSLTEEGFKATIQLAKRVGSKSLELRTSTSPARLLATQGRRDEVHALSYTFTSGSEAFDTADPHKAEVLLTVLHA